MDENKFIQELSKSFPELSMDVNAIIQAKVFVCSMREYTINCWNFADPINAKIEINEYNVKTILRIDVVGFKINIDCALSNVDKHKVDDIKKILILFAEAYKNANAKITE